MRIPLQGHLGGMSDGDYRFGIRASDCFLRRGGDGMLAVPARVELSEISGSATFIYLRHGELRFIVEEEGVFHHELEEELTFYLEPRKLIAFSRPGAADGSKQALVASYR
jgi:glycerol transport system ATP-binding protein